MNQAINPRSRTAVAPALSTKAGAAAALARHKRVLAEREQAAVAAQVPRPRPEQLTSPDIEKYRRLLDEAITAELRRRLGDAYCGDKIQPPPTSPGS